MEKLKEEIAKWIYELWFEPTLPYRCGWGCAAPDWKQVCYNKAAQILTLFQDWLEKEIGGLKVIGGTEIGDNLDLDVEGEYPCSDGSSVSTISVTKVLQAQLDDVKKHIEVGFKKVR